MTVLQDVKHDTKERKTWKKNLERYSFKMTYYIYESKSKVLDRNMVKIAYSIRDYYVDYYV